MPASASPWHADWMPPAPGFLLHQILHRAVYLLCGSGVVALLFSVTPRVVPNLRFAGFLLCLFAWAAYLADGINTDLRSPTVTYVGELGRTRTAHSRNTRWYEVQLVHGGETTRWFDWLSHTHLPRPGDGVAISVHAWDESDTTRVQVLSGPEAGFVHRSNAMVGFEAAMLVIPALLIVFIAAWWLLFLKAQEASD